MPVHRKQQKGNQQYNYVHCVGKRNNWREKQWDRLTEREGGRLTEREGGRLMEREGGRQANRERGRKAG